MILNSLFKSFCKDFLETAFLHLAYIQVYDDEPYIQAIIFNENHPDYDREDENGDPVYMRFTLADYVTYILNKTS